MGIYMDIKNMFSLITELLSTIEPLTVSDVRVLTNIGTGFVVYDKECRAVNVRLDNDETTDLSNVINYIS